MQTSGAPFEIGPVTSVSPKGERFRRWLLQKPTKGQVAFIAGALLTAICAKGPEMLARALGPVQTAGDVAVRARGSRADAIAIPALRDIPNVTVSYYDVQATDVAGSRAELRNSGIRWGKKRFRAMTTWNYDWRWDAAPGGGCGTAGARVKFEAKVTLPRHANPDALSPEVARAWNSYTEALIRHEANHVRLAHDGRLLVADAVRSSGCDSANSAGELAVAKINHESAKYDERTYYGWREGARFSLLSRPITTKAATDRRGRGNGRVVILRLD